mmetsp:Transcript_5607/g.16701  ORF Transcript_5607/g.16701 Transcript_5607/m.16701 type:complete len:285 (+) Transcript_5607:100-954(+)
MAFVAGGGALRVRGRQELPPHTRRRTTSSKAVVRMARKKASEYNMNLRLREELEAPFRKVRMTIYGASAASAAVGGFIAGSRIIAALTGVSGVQPLSETVPNVAIDLGVIVGAVLLYRQETKAGERRLERIARGAAVAGLNVQISNGKVIKIGDLQNSRRVLIVGGSEEQVTAVLKDGAKFQSRLLDRELVVVPIVFDKRVSFAELKGEWEGQVIAEALQLNAWREWAEEEAKRARTVDIEKGLFMTIIRKDGKVGARSAQAISWERLLVDLERLPKRDKRGTP